MSSPPVESHSCSRIPRRFADDDFAASPAAGQFAADERNSSLGWQHVDAGQLHHLGNGPAVAMPMPPHAVQSMTMPRVSGRVVRKLDVILQSRSLAAL